MCRISLVKPILKDTDYFKRPFAYDKSLPRYISDRVHNVNSDDVISKLISLSQTTWRLNVTYFKLTCLQCKQTGSLAMYEVYPECKSRFQLLLLRLTMIHMLGILGTSNLRKEPIAKTAPEWLTN